MRILVTGSRNWTDRQAIDDAIWTAVFHFLPMPPPPLPNVWIIHGDSLGADTLAKQIADATPGFAEEPHPADWTYWRKKTPAYRKNPAGMIRNREMIILGADVCLAFIMPCRMRTCRNKSEHGSHGASNCADMAEAAGIPTRRYGFTGFAKGGVLRPNSAETDPIPFQPDNGYLITPDQAKRLGTAPLDRLLEGTDL